MWHSVLMIYIKYIFRTSCSSFVYNTYQSSAIHGYWTSFHLGFRSDIQDPSPAALECPVLPHVVHVGNWLSGEPLYENLPHSITTFYTVHSMISNHLLHSPLNDQSPPSTQSTQWSVTTFYTVHSMISHQSPPSTQSTLWSITTFYTVHSMISHHLLHSPLNDQPPQSTQTTQWSVTTFRLAINSSYAKYQPHFTYSTMWELQGCLHAPAGPRTWLYTWFWERHIIFEVIRNPPTYWFFRYTKLYNNSEVET